MSHHNCPNPNSRNRADDLKVLSVAVVKDRLSFFEGRNALTDHVADTPDLLYGWVEMALGVSSRINWSEVTDDELPAIKAWQDYCGNLFDSVKDHVVNTLLA